MQDLPSRTFAPTESPIQERRETHPDQGMPGWVRDALWLFASWAAMVFSLLLAANAIRVFAQGGNRTELLACLIGTTILGLFTTALQVSYRAQARVRREEREMMRASVRMPWHETPEDAAKRQEIINRANVLEVRRKIAEMYAHPLLLDGKISPTLEDVLRILDNAERRTVSEPKEHRGRLRARIIVDSATIPLPPVPPAMAEERVVPRAVVRPGGTPPMMPLDEDAVSLDGAQAVAAEVAAKSRRGKRRAVIAPEIPRPAPKEKPAYKRLLASTVRKAMASVLADPKRKVSDVVLADLGLSRSKRNDLRDLLQEAGVAAKRDGRHRGAVEMDMELSADEVMSRLESLLGR